MRPLPDRSAALLLACMLASCAAERRAEWGYRFEPAGLARAPLQLIASLRDGCGADARELDTWVVGASETPMERRSGEPVLALHLRAVEAGPGCSVYAEGCAPLGEGRTEVALRPVSNAALCPGSPHCAELACDGLDGGVRDAGMDGGVDGGPDGGLDGGVEGGVDGGPRDGGPSDGGPRDAGQDAGPPSCESLRVAGLAWACDDFEGTLRDPRVGRTTAGAGALDLVASHARTGSGSMRASITGGSDQAFLDVEAIPAIAPEIWARAWVYFEPFPHTNTFVYLYGGAGGQGISVLLDSVRRVAVWLGPEPTWHDYAGSTYPSGWTCVELHVVVAETDGRVEAYANGTLLRTITGRTASPDGPYEVFQLGFIGPQSSAGAGTMYIDDIAVGPMRLPCP